MKPTGPWWGEFEIRTGESRRWRLGPFTLWVSRRAGEVRVATRSETGDDIVCVAAEACDEPVPDDVDLVRYGVRESVRELEIGPVTADRAAVVKSENDYVVPPGGAVTAFISTPLWLQVRLTAPVRLLHEVPTQRPSDTWFGPSTLEGELCYAVRTSVRYTLENVPVRPNRAVSVVRVLNHAATPLPLARLRLPLPYLSLFADGDGRLWTEAVTLDRQEEGDRAAIKLGKSAPQEAGECKRVCGPREKLGRQNLIRSFTGLLGLTGGRGGHERVVE
jgi:hypothetical protein